MPQATEELRSKWGGQQGVGEDKAEDFLKERGYKLTRQWLWEKPTPAHTPTDEELEAMAFLIQEWDYGGLVEQTEEPGGTRKKGSRDGRK